MRSQSREQSHQHEVDVGRDQATLKDQWRCRGTARPKSVVKKSVDQGIDDALEAGDVTRSTNADRCDDTSSGSSVVRRAGMAFSSPTASAIRRPGVPKLTPFAS